MSAIHAPVAVHNPPILHLKPANATAPSQNPALVYLASLSAGSRRTMRQALDTIAGLATAGACDHITMPWGELRFAHTHAVRARLAAEYNARTANKMLSALRQTLKNAWRLGYMTAEEYARAVDIDAVPIDTPSQAETGRHLQLGEMMALISTCVAEGSCAGIRDAAIIAVGYAAGLRRSELSNLAVGDVDLAHQQLTVRSGKRNKTRVVYLAHGALDALADWLHVRRAEEGALFTRIRKGDHLTQAGMTSQAIYNVLRRRAMEAGVKTFTPHDLRRTFAGDLLDAGADISTVQQLMGHSNVTTTAGYDRRDARAKRAAVAKLHVPYMRQYREP